MYVRTQVSPSRLHTEHGVCQNTSLTLPATRHCTRRVSEEHKSHPPGYTTLYTVYARAQVSPSRLHNIVHGVCQKNTSLTLPATQYCTRCMSEEHKSHSPDYKTLYTVCVRTQVSPSRLHDTVHGVCQKNLTLTLQATRYCTRCVTRTQVSPSRLHDTVHGVSQEHKSHPPGYTILYTAYVRTQVSPSRLHDTVHGVSEEHKSHPPGYMILYTVCQKNTILTLPATRHCTRCVSEEHKSHPPGYMILYTVCQKNTSLTLPAT